MKPRHPDPYDAARLLVAAVYYELPGDKGEAYWTNQIASRYGLFRSQCMAKRVDADKLPGRIRAQARVLTDFLGLGNIHPLRLIGIRAVIENALAELVGAPDAVRTGLMRHQKLLTDTLYDQLTNDTPGYDEDYEPPTGVMGTSETNRYHVFNQQ